MVLIKNRFNVFYLLLCFRFAGGQHKFNRMKRIKLITEKDKNGKTIFKAGKVEEVPQHEIEKAKNIIDSAKNFIKRISIVDISKLNKKFNI